MTPTELVDAVVRFSIEAEGPEWSPALASAVAERDRLRAALIELIEAGKECETRVCCDTPDDDGRSNCEPLLCDSCAASVRYRAAVEACK
jgi:hypothetical protein